MRGTVGITVALQAWLAIASINPGLFEAMPSAALIVCGIALTLGILTPIFSALVGLGYALVLFGPFDGIALPRLDHAAALIGLAAAAGLAFLGPGAFSLDARLFGRRQIFIPGKDS